MSLLHLFVLLGKVNVFHITKHAYSNILKNSPLKTMFSDKNSDFFSYFCSKHKLWVLVRIASPICDFEQK